MSQTTKMFNDKTLSDNIYDVLLKIHQKNNGFPHYLADAFSVSRRPSNRNGAVTRAYSVKIGDATIMYQYDATIKAKDMVPDAVRFSRTLKFDIPQLAGGKSVCYYVNHDIGCICWDKFITIVRGLEVNKGEFLSEDLETFMRRRD